LIFPFADSSEVDDVLEPLERVFAAFHAVRVRASPDGAIPGLLYLRPEPAETFVVITEALVNAFPDFPPYAGEFAEIVRTSPSRRRRRGPGGS